MKKLIIFFLIIIVNLIFSSIPLYGQAGEISIDSIGTIDGHLGYYQSTSVLGVLQKTDFIFEENGHARWYAYKMSWQNTFTMLPDSTYFIKLNSIKIGDTWTSWTGVPTTAIVVDTETVTVQAGTFYTYIVNYYMKSIPDSLVMVSKVANNIGAIKRLFRATTTSLSGYSIAGGTGYYPLAVGNWWRGESTNGSVLPIFSDNFNRSDEYLTTPWFSISDMLYIHTQQVYGRSNKYGLMMYYDKNDSTQSVQLSVDFNFANDNNGRFQFMIYGAFVQESASGYIAKISDSTVSFWSIDPEVLLLPSSNYSFQANTNYTAILKNDASTLTASITIKNSLGATVLSLGVPSPRRYFYAIAVGIDNDNLTTKFLDNVIYEGLTTTGVAQTPYTNTPSRFTLSQNYPNPFNPTTIISFNLVSPSLVSLKVFDLLGREVATLVSEKMSAGDHSQQWNASGIASGIYFYRLQAGKFSETKKLIIVR